MKRVTVVVPNYNGIQYIENCMRSLQTQTEVEFDVIMVDNGSTDGSKEKIEKLFPQVHIYSFLFNTGFSVAVNKGIELSKTPYVILLNNDTVVEPQFVRALADAIEKDPVLFSVAAKMIDMKNPQKMDGGGDYYNALGWAFASGKGKLVTANTKEKKIFSSCAGAAIYRKEVFDKIGLFDENHFAYLEDVDIGYRALLFGYRNRYTPMATVFHAGSAVSGSRHNAFKVGLTAQNTIYVAYKNMPFLQLIINLPLIILGIAIKFAFFSVKRLGRSYVKGILKGIALCFSKKGRKNKVPFSFKRMPNYGYIQLQLWINIARQLFA